MLSFDLVDLINQTPKETDIERLREAAFERSHEDADNAVVYYHRALEIISEYSAYEPDPSEVADLVSGDDAGDWRNVMTACAYLTARTALEQSAGEAIERLENAYIWAEGEGYEVAALHTSCIYGWAPHAWERDEDEGVLYYWPRLDGGSDKYLFHMTEDGVWIELTRETDEA